MASKLPAPAGGRGVEVRPLHPAHGPCLVLLALLTLAFSGTAAWATPYSFLSVTGNGLGGNAASTTFTSSYGYGAISVSHVFSSAAGVGYADNNNALIFPSRFTTLFPGTGQVQGHLAMTVYDNSSRVIFNLAGYTGDMPRLVFGIWNTTDEVALPAYNVQLLNASNQLVPPATFSLIGNQDNQTQVAGRHREQLNVLNGDITAPILINAGGVHTDAMFFDGIPAGTKQIIVTANLPPLNLIGDGVGYYFAEQIPVPEPSSRVLVVVALAALVLVRLGRTRLRNA